MPQTIDVETGKHGQQYAWSEKEMRSLVEFVALYWDHADKSTHWPKNRVLGEMCHLCCRKLQKGKASIHRKL